MQKLLDWFKNLGPTVYAVVIFVSLFITGLLTECHGAELALSGGSAVIRGPAPVAELELLWPSKQSSDAHWETGITLLGSSIYGGAYQQPNFVLNATYVDGLGPVDLGLGVAYLQNMEAYNSSNLNFNLVLGYHNNNWFVRWNHYSNAGTRPGNLGRDMVLLGKYF